MRDAKTADSFVHGVPGAGERRRAMPRAPLIAAAGACGAALVVFGLVVAQPRQRPAALAARLASPHAVPPGMPGHPRMAALARALSRAPRHKSDSMPPFPIPLPPPDGGHVRAPTGGKIREHDAAVSRRAVPVDTRLSALAHAVKRQSRQPQQHQQLLALRLDAQHAAADASVLFHEEFALADAEALSAASPAPRKLGAKGLMQSLQRARTQRLNVPNAKPLVYPNDAAAYGADGGGSGWKATPVGAINAVHTSAQWEYPGFVCYDPNGCNPPEDPTETQAEARAEAYADDPSYYGDGGVDDAEVGAPWHSPTPYRGTYMHATFPYENEPTGFFAGWHTVENTGLNVGMGKHRDVNSYFYPDAVRVTTGDWHFHNYDLDGSYMVPEVCRRLCVVARALEHTRTRTRTRTCTRTRTLAHRQNTRARTHGHGFRVWNEPGANAGGCLRHVQRHAARARHRDRP